jgi:endonuclease/exonuclease/phosphatase family metal-dependent hydrolase
VINFKHVDAFNDLINKWGLMEIKDPTRTFSWSNNQADPILAKLDRILVTIDWDTKYPLTKMKTLPRGFSDHCPLRIDFGGKAQFKESLFRFEK